MAKWDDEDKDKKDGDLFSDYSSFVDTTEKFMSGVAGQIEPTFANITQSAEDLYQKTGLEEKFGPNAIKYASEQIKKEMSDPTLDATKDMGWFAKKAVGLLATPGVLSTLALEGTSGLNWAQKSAWETASNIANKSAKKEAKKYGYELDKDVMPKTTFGLKDIIQGSYENAAGDPIPIPRPNFTVSTGTGKTITPTYIGLLNNQGASGGQVSRWGGQPRHHITGLLGVLENLTGNSIKDIGTVVSRIMENRSSGIDKDEDKLASVWT
jgi:hypothetical protein